MIKKNILLVFTGGTIGSAPREGFLVPDGEESRRLLLQQFSIHKQSFYEKQFGLKLCFDMICPYEILSENLNGSHLELLEDAITRKQNDMTKQTGLVYDGIIVTVGTDTLAYSSAALGYLFADTKIPLVTVSANYPLTDKRSNGLSNFEAAVLLILEGKHNGVFCAYQNDDMGKPRQYIHYATRLLPQINYSHLVWSVKGACYAEIKKDEEGSAYLDVNRTGKAKACENDERPVKLHAEGLSRTRVALLRPYPGIYYTVPAYCDAILLDTYHSGTLPVEDSRFQAFVQEAYAMKIPIFIAGVSAGMTYETVKAYRLPGIKVLPEASAAAMYMKLWLCLANGLDLEKNMPRPLAGDIF